MNDTIIKGFKELINKGKIPERFLKILKTVVKAKEDYNKKKITKQEIEKIRKEANIFIRTMVEIVQRKKGLDLERAKIKVKHGDKIGEVLVLDKTAFIIKDVSSPEKEVLKGVVDKDKIGEFKKSSLNEIEEFLKNLKVIQKVSLTEKTISDLKKVFGNNLEILLN